jgi:hypothetical protein
MCVFYRDGSRYRVDYAVRENNLRTGYRIVNFYHSNLGGISGRRGFRRVTDEFHGAIA